MAPSTACQTFRDVVAQVAEKARAILPASVNGRIESAVRLVLMHDVMPQADGSILVGSSRDPLTSYLLVGTACECQDFTYGQAPDGWCAHRIAAGIHKRVRELLPPEPAPGGIGLTDTAPGAVSSTYTTPLPEAPASVNCHIQVAGRQVQLTLCDSDEARLLQRLAVVLAQFEMTQPPAQASTQPQGQGEGWCRKHGVQMKRQAKGDRSWWSHWLPDNSWCKGK